MQKYENRIRDGERKDVFVVTCRAELARLVSFISPA